MISALGDLNVVKVYHASKEDTPTKSAECATITSKARDPRESLAPNRDGKIKRITRRDVAASRESPTDHAACNQIISRRKVLQPLNYVHYKEGYAPLFSVIILH
jgi:hypothetical protein